MIPASIMMYSIQLYILNFICYLLQVDGFLPILISSSNNHHNITEILLKVELNIHNPDFNLKFCCVIFVRLYLNCIIYFWILFLCFMPTKRVKYTENVCLYIVWSICFLELFYYVFHNSYKNCVKIKRIWLNAVDIHAKCWIKKSVQPYSVLHLDSTL